ncbi:MAG: GEVED domain-containing protein [Bacteroidia bacterium]
MKKLTTSLFLLLIIGITSFTNLQADCPVTALSSNGSTSGNARCPIGNFRFIRGVYLITAAEMTASGFTNGQVFNQIGWAYSTAHNISVSGNLQVYFQNTADITTTKSTNWATAIAPMFLASNSAATIPAGNFFTTALSNPTFTYTGGGLYVGYEWSNPTNPLSLGAVVSCTNQPVLAMLNSQQSNVALPVTLAAASNFRPDTRIGTTGGIGLCPCLPTSSNGGVGGDAITAFSFASLNYATATGVGIPGYLSYGGATIAAGQGVTYSVSITNQFAGDANNIWIDFNDNGVFDDLGEAVFQGGPGTSVTGSIIMSPTAPLGLHKLRLRNYDTSSGNPLGTVTPCSSVVFGETKDFFINIVPPFTDVQVTNLYTLGKVAIEYGSPMTINARVANGGTTTVTNYNVHLAVTGTNSFSTDTTVTLSPGQNTLVSFPPYTPALLSAGDVITVSVAPDAFNSNNSQTWTQAVTQNLYSYKNPAQVNAGGVGFNGGTGDFVAKFNSHIGTNFPYNVYNPQVNQIQVDFFGTNGVTYQLGIWDATGPGGIPGTNLWTSANLTQVGGTSFIPVPNVSVSGDYFVGVRQTGVVNVGFAFQTEAPIRAGTFYFTSPTGTSTWTDFSATSSNFRFSIVAQVRIPQAPNCPINMLPADLSIVCPLGPTTLTWTSGGGATADNYDVYLSTNLSDVNSHAPAALVSAAQVGTSYTTPGTLTPGLTYYWTIVARSISEALTSVGCATQSFTMGTSFVDCYCVPVHPFDCGNGQITNVTLNGINNSTTCTSPAYSVYAPGAGTTTAVNNGVTYKLKVTTDNIDITSVWFDWDQNGVFDSTEWSQVNLASAAGVADSVLITVPINATAGQTRMRIRTRFAGNPNAATDACTSFGSGESEDYTITVEACSGTPDPANTISATDSVCPGVPFNLSLQNAQVPTGINYQWQSTTDTNLTWNNVGPNAAVYPASQTVPTYYRCLVTCTVSSLSTISTPVRVGLNIVPKPYLTINDTAVCSNDPGFYIHVKDSAAYAGGYPVGTTFEFVGITVPTNLDDSTFISSSAITSVIVTLPPYLGGCSNTTGLLNIDFGSTQAGQIALSTDSVKCFGGSTGNAIASIVFGGSANYRWQWYSSGFNNLLRDVTNSLTVDSLKGVPAGMYILVLTDHQGAPTSPYCEVTDSVYVGGPAAPLSATENTLNHVNVSCNGNNNGALDINASGGTPPYSYSWNNGASTKNLSGLAAGTYTCTITDSRGCTTTISVTITQPLTLSANCLSTNAVCFNANNGTVTVGASNGTGPYNYLWSNGSTNASQGSLAPGTYTVTVTDAHGCTVQCTSTVTQPAQLTVSISGNTAICIGSPNPLTAGAGFTSYLWSTGATTQSINGAGGTYTVTVTNASGCTATASKTVATTGSVPPQPGIIAGSVAVCKNSDANYSIVNVPGATGYTWTVSAGASISAGQGFNSVTVHFSNTATSSSISVVANNICGSGAARTLAYVVSSIAPSQPSAINGSLYGLCNQTNVPYNCPVAVNAVSYLWTVPSGATVLTGQGTNSISVKYGAAFTGTGTISVQAQNGCGSSAVVSRTVNAKAQQPVISGLNWACKGQPGLNYSVAAVPGASSYIWTIVPGSTLVSGQGTTSIVVNWGNINGQIKCTANNICGSSMPASLAVAFTCREAGMMEDFSELSLYPNPATTSAEIQFDGFAAGKGQLAVYDLIGQQVLNKDIAVVTGNNNFKLDLSTLAKGAYMVRVTYNGVARNCKLIVQ